MTVLYEDNHIIIVNKSPGEIVQGDKTGDRPLAEEVKAYIKEKYAKPGAVFLGVVHRLDRPVSGVVVFARTGKALSRLNEMFRTGKVRKTYHAIVPAVAAATVPQTLDHWLTRNERQNKAYAHPREVAGSKHALLDYVPLACGERYALIEVHLHTGRHHQIRCQLATVGMPIKGDLKYGAPRSNDDGSISLHARRVELEHPVSHQMICVEAPYPSQPLWRKLAAAASSPSSSPSSSAQS
jgi:23S rRNA pseudouridine1911/1915/1917 synthase